MSENKKLTPNLKSPLIFNNQLELLKSRNIVVSDKDQALDFLKNIY